MLVLVRIRDLWIKAHFMNDNRLKRQAGMPHGEKLPKKKKKKADSISSIATLNFLSAPNCPFPDDGPGYGEVVYADMSTCPLSSHNSTREYQYCHCYYHRS